MIGHNATAAAGRISPRSDGRGGLKRRRLPVASIEYVDVRKGMVIVGDDGLLYQCLDRDLNTPGNWRGILQLNLENLKTGSITLNRGRPPDKVDVAYLEQKDFQDLYQGRSEYVLIETETYDQAPLPKALLPYQ